MKFVHLCGAGAVDKIRRVGLRMGDGDFGRGVYCVPRVLLPRRSEHGPSNPVTSASLWKPIWKDPGDASRWRKHAVVFVPPASAWPMSLHLEIRGEEIESFVRALETVQAVPDLSPTDLAAARRARARGSELVFALELPDSRAVGFWMHLYRSSGCTPSVESVQAVFREPIPARWIRRILPLDGGRTRRGDRGPSPAAE